QLVALHVVYSLAGLFCDGGWAFTEGGQPRGNHVAVLQEESPLLIPKGRPVFDEPLSDAMQRLDILLLNRFNRHSWDVGPLARFRQRQRILRIIFLPTPERGHVLWGE